MERARHHILSRGYQRFFADGDQIRLIWKNERRDRLVGTRDAFVVEHFGSIRLPDGTHWNELENEWSRMENVALPQIRKFIAGERSTATEYAVIILAALHWVRSYAVRAVFDRVYATSFRDALGELEHSDFLRNSFLEDVGRLPAPGEISLYIRDYVEYSGQLLWMEILVSSYNDVQEHLLTGTVQRIVASHPEVGFVTGDCPVVNMDSTLLRVGPLHGDLAFGDSNMLYMPLSPRVAVGFPKRVQPDLIVSPLGAQILNQVIWRNAVGYLAAHPGQDWKRCLKGAPLAHRGSTVCA